MPNLQIERLRKLPQRTDETWQAALFRMPMWAKGDDGMPVRPWTAVCMSTRTGRMGPAEPKAPAERSSRLVLDSVVGLASGKEGGYRPGQLEVSQPEVAAELVPLLAEVGVKVVERSELGALDDAMREMRRYFRNGMDDPAALEVVGVTIEHLRRFAEAAKEFYEASPWRHLSDGDLIEIISPKIESALKFTTVMGAGAREFGLAFFESRRQHERMFELDDPRSQFASRGVWSFTFDPIFKLPLGDADAWEDHGLPVAKDDAYPFFARLGPGPAISRPTPAQWIYVEGLLRALARSTEPEMDSGRWSKTVPTRAGDTEYVLTLPALLEPAVPDASRRQKGLPDRRAMERTLADIGRAMAGMEFSSPEELQSYLNTNFTGKPVPHQAPRTPLERAQDSVYEAVEARGRRQLQLLRKALEVSPDCADAYVMMAERTGDVKAARDLYAQGVAAGERALGRRTFKEDAGHFWGVFETRPYMRARFGLGHCCERLGQLDEAVGHYEDLLRLNSNDNQGVRYRFAGCLLRAKRFDRLEELLVRYEEDSAHWLYVAALASFVRSGDTPRSRELLSSAHEANRHVRKYLLGIVPLPEDQAETIRFGGEDEAVAVASELIEEWQASPGALAWLQEHTKSERKRRTGRRK